MKRCPHCGVFGSAAWVDRVHDASHAAIPLVPVVASLTAEHGPESAAVALLMLARGLVEQNPELTRFDVLASMVREIPFVFEVNRPGRH